MILASDYKQVQKVEMHKPQYNETYPRGKGSTGPMQALGKGKNA